MRCGCGDSVRGGGAEWQAAVASSKRGWWWQRLSGAGAHGRSVSGGGTGCAWRRLQAGVERRRVEVRDTVVVARAGGVQASAGANRAAAAARRQ